MKKNNVIISVLLLFFLSAIVGCFRADKEEKISSSNEPRGTQSPLVHLGEPTPPSSPSTHSKKISPIIINDPLFNLSNKKFKKEYAKLPDDYKIKIGLEFVDFENAFELKVGSFGTITKRQAKKVRSVYADSDFSFDMSLKGLRYFPNVEYIYWEGQSLREISEIEYLPNLEGITFNGCNLGIEKSTNELRCLAVMKKIHISITACDLNDIGFMSYFPTINSSSTELYLSDNLIKDIRPLNNLKEVETLDLMSNQLEDIRPLSNLKKVHRRLWLSYNQIKDISPLSNLEEVSSLMLSGNKISDLTPLENLKKIESLWLDNNELQDISILLTLPTLKKLNVEGNPNIEPAQIEEFKKRAANGEFVFEY